MGGVMISVLAFDALVGSNQSL